MISIWNSNRESEPSAPSCNVMVHDMALMPLEKCQSLHYTHPISRLQHREVGPVHRERKFLEPQESRGVLQ